MVVVDVEEVSICVAVANGARSTLRCEHLVVLFWGDSVMLLQASATLRSLKFLWIGLPPGRASLVPARTTI